jgi:hypothetical protein
MSGFHPERFRAIQPEPRPVKPAAPKKAKKRTTTPSAPLPPSTWKEGKLSIILAVPVVALRPNGAHGHWRAVRKARATAKARATLSTLQVLGGATAPCATAYSLIYYFHSQPWDDDNAIASVKSYLDGISSALGIDDRHLRFRELIRRTDRACPRVEIIMHLTPH